MLVVADGTERDDGGGLEPGGLGIHAGQALRRQQHQEIAEAAVAHRAVVLCAQGPGEQRQVRGSDASRMRHAHCATARQAASGSTTCARQIHTVMQRMAMTALGTTCSGGKRDKLMLT